MGGGVQWGCMYSTLEALREIRDAIFEFEAVTSLQVTSNMRVVVHILDASVGSSRLEYVGWFPACLSMNRGHRVYNFESRGKVLLSQQCVSLGFSDGTHVF